MEVVIIKGIFDPIGHGILIYNLNFYLVIWGEKLLLFPHRLISLSELYLMNATIIKRKVVVSDSTFSGEHLHAKTDWARTF